MTGRITKEYTVWCNGCPKFHQEQAGLMKAAINIFHSLGWRIKKGTGCALIAWKGRMIKMKKFKYELFLDGKLKMTMYTMKKLLSGVRMGRNLLKDHRYDCVEIHCDGKWIKEYSNRGAM